MAAIILFLVAWDLSVRLQWVDPLFLAGPLETLSQLVPVARAASVDLFTTLISFIAAFIIGVLAAVALGMLINMSEYARKVFMPLLALGVTIPKVTLIPLFLLWFGIDRTPVVVFAALSGFFPMIVNVMAGVSDVKPGQILLAKAMGCGRFQIFRKVVFPAMLPVLSSGSFYACNAAMMGVFIVELAQSRHGLGAVVHDYAVTFKTPELYAAVTLTASIAIAINMALWYLARYIDRWRR